MAGALVIATSLGLCVASDIDRTYFTRWPARLTEKYAKQDALIGSAAAPGRGVFLKFINFPKNAGGFTANIYFRAVYALYPQPVVVAEPGVLVNGTPQLLKGNSIPDDRSLRDRGVGSVIVLKLMGMQPVIMQVKWLTR